MEIVPDNVFSAKVDQNKTIDFKNEETALAVRMGCFLEQFRGCKSEEQMELLLKKECVGDADLIAVKEWLTLSLLDLHFNEQGERRVGLIDAEEDFKWEILKRLKFLMKRIYEEKMFPEKKESLTNINDD